MAKVIKIEGNHLVIYDDGTGAEEIRYPAGGIVPKFDGDDVVFVKYTVQFTPMNPNGEPYDATTLVDDRTGAVFADLAAFKKFIGRQTGFFFNQTQPVNVQYAKSPNVDAFGRLRVSQVTTQLDAKQLYDKLPLLIDEALIGTGNALHDTTEAATTLSTAADADAAILQTKQRFDYTSGKSQLLFWTFDGFTIESGVTKRVGYFSSNTSTPFNSELDGFWLENDGTDLRVKVYKNGTEIDNVVQDDWDDPLDGSGASGVTHDFDNNTILWGQYEWLGVGEVVLGIVKSGTFIPFIYLDHTDDNGVYMSSPNQPMRWEVRQSGGGSGSFSVICSSVSSEGSINVIGKNGGVDDDGDHLNANSTNEWYMAIALRLKADRLSSIVKILKGYLISDTNDKFLIRILLNPTYENAPTWVDVDDYGVQYALGIGTGGSSTEITDEGYILEVGGGDSQTVENFDINGAIRLGANIDGTVDEIAVAVKPLSANLDIHRGLTFRDS